MIYSIDSDTFVWSSMGSIWTTWWNDLGDKLRKVINNWQNRKERKRIEKKNRVEFDYLERAVNDRLFTGAIPQLVDAEAFACCVSTVGRFAPL